MSNLLFGSSNVYRHFEIAKQQVIFWKNCLYVLFCNDMIKLKTSKKTSLCLIPMSPSAYVYNQYNSYVVYNV